MKNKLRKLTSFVMILSILAASFYGCTGNGAQQTSDPKKVESIKFVTFSYGETPDSGKVINKLNEISRKAIGVEASIEFVNLANYEEQVNMKLASGDSDEMDIYVAMQNFSSMASKGQARAIDDLIGNYGADIKKSLGNLLNFAPVNGKNYFIPFNSSKVYYCTFVCRKDLCDKYNIDLTSVKNYKDLENVFKVIHEKEPKMTPIAPDYSSVIANVDLDSTAMPAFDQLGDNIGVLTGANGTKIENVFETKAYEDIIETLYSWNKKGYISKDAAASSEIGSQTYKEGKVFSYMSSMVLEDGTKPYEHKGLSTVTYPTYTLALDKPAINSTTGFYALGISPTSKKAEAAMKWINLLYSNPEMLNTLYYGVENQHWVKNANGTIKYADGITAGKTGWDTAFSWLIGDNNLGYVFSSVSNDPDYNKKINAQNKSATISKAFGFTFKSDSVATQYSSVANVIQRNQRVLECGAVDPKTQLKKFNQDLKNAGIDTVIAEKQKQMDAWLKTQKH